MGRTRRKPRTVFGTAHKDRFFAHLAESCDVQASARAAGISLSRIYALRVNDIAFRHGWEKALREGYAQLEMEALRRARFGMLRTETSDGTGGRKIHNYDNGLLIHLLNRHAAIGRSRPSDESEAPADPDAVIARMRATLGQAARDETGANEEDAG